MIRPFTCICLLAAASSGLYLYQTKHRAQVLDRDIARVMVSSHEMQRFSSTGCLSLDKDRTAVLAANEYVLLSTGEKSTIPARFTSEAEFVKLHVPEVLHVAQGRSIKLRSPRTSKKVGIAKNAGCGSVGVNLNL